MKARLYVFLEWFFTFVVPRRWRYAIARSAAKAICRIDRSRRLIIEANLVPLVGQEQARKKAPALLAGFATTAVDFFCQPAEVLNRVTIENGRTLEDAYQMGRPIMCVTAHVGHWEIGVACLAEKGYHVAGVYSPFSDPHFDQWMKRHRDARVDWIPVGSQTVRRCLQSLRDRHIIGMVADVPFGEEGQPVSLAGNRTRAPKGPWVIARRAKALVFPCFMIRTAPGCYTAKIHNPIDAGRAGITVADMMSDYLNHLMRYLTAYPEQWGLLTPFWERVNANN